MKPIFIPFTNLQIQLYSCALSKYIQLSPEKLCALLSMAIKFSDAFYFRVALAVSSVYLLYQRF